MKVWNWQAGQEQTAISMDERIWSDNHRANGYVPSASFSPDGNVILIPHGRIFALHDTKTGEELRRFYGHGFVNTAIFSADGRYIYSASGKTIKKWRSGLVPQRASQVQMLAEAEGSQNRQSDMLDLQIALEGDEYADSYVVIILPDDSVISYQGAGRFSAEILPYQQNLLLTEMQSEPLFQFNLRQIDVPSGEYQACGLLTKPDSNPLDSNQWIDWDCMTLVVNGVSN